MGGGGWEWENSHCTLGARGVSENFCGDTHPIPPWVLLLTQAYLMCACSRQGTKMCFLLLPFQPWEEFYCQCWFVGETARASLLSWKFCTPAPIACYLLLLLGNYWWAGRGLRYMNFLQIWVVGFFFVCLFFFSSRHGGGWDELYWPCFIVLAW